MNAPALRIKAPTKAQQKKEAQARKLKPLGTGMMLPGLVAEQKRMLARRIYGTQPDAPGRITNSSTRGKYKGEGIDQSSMRPGANDFLQIPSRFNDDLSYRKDSGWPAEDKPTPFRWAYGVPVSVRNMPGK